jgi:hypothetical protein
MSPANEPTFGEFLVKFDGHEQRDIDRFQQMCERFDNGVKVLSEKLDEMRKDLAAQVADHEIRIRSLEVNVTRVLTWGTIGLFLVGLTEYALHYFIK